MTTKEALEPQLEPCRCGRKALIERFYDGDDPQPLFVATCEICPVKTYDQFSMEEAARIWNEFVSATVNMPDGQWQHVQIKAGNPRVVAIQFETPEQATAFINSFATAPSVAPVVDAEKRARDLVDAFRFASPPVQSLRFLEWEPLVAAIADALRAPAATVAPQQSEQSLKKLAARIIDAVVRSPCVVDVRFFSQPEEAVKLENQIAEMLTPLTAPASPAALRDEAEQVDPEMLRTENERLKNAYSLAIQCVEFAQGKRRRGWDIQFVKEQLADAIKPTPVN